MCSESNYSVGVLQVQQCNTSVGEVAAGVLQVQQCNTPVR